MEKAFDIAGYDKETLKDKFGALYNAFQFGAPPHAGMNAHLSKPIVIEEVIKTILRYVHND